MTAIRTSPSAGPGSAEITGFYEKDTGSIQYLAACPATGKAAIIDAVLNFDPRSARTWTDSADQVLQFAAGKGYEIEWILDTHPHADHLMASAYLKEKLGAPTCIGEKVREIAGIWGELYGAPEMFDPDRDFDRLLENGEAFRIGDLDVQVMLSPGHTLGSVTYVVGNDAAFVHDTLMQADVGSSRADFPGGSAAELWDSIQRILSLPEATRLFIGHDYGAKGRDGPEWEATVAEHLEKNPHVHRGMKREDFIALRETRDAGLPLPDRMLHALQVNLRGGRLPEADEKGRSFFRIPANRF
ncbi:MBL fold metallo-hydrolase [Rhodovulum sp. DZ06]|uniref:MBL fold metallo-hydrolase n=1 Tax=Rhodovulum sp. DZ06 TaxID=3425126 RepID=UPI003D34D186